MQPLRLNSSGAEVSRLQERLKELGFNPGNIDGEFGTGTEAAVIAFQRSEGLLADGVVGTNTLRALSFEPDASAVAAESVMPKVTVAIVSQMFPQTPLDNIKKHLPFVLKALEERDLTDRGMVLMALATIRAETAGFVPIDEGKSRFNTSPGGKPRPGRQPRPGQQTRRGRPDSGAFPEKQGTANQRSPARRRPPAGPAARQRR